MLKRGNEERGIIVIFQALVVSFVYAHTFFRYSASFTD